MNRRCARCGGEVGEADAFCPACGQAVSAAAPGGGTVEAASPPAAAAETAGDDRVRFVIMVELALAVLVVTWLGLRSMQDDYAAALHPAPWYVEHPLVAGVALAAAVLFWGRVLIALLRIEDCLAARAPRP